MSRVIFFEIHADDLARARSFYSDVFGWTFQQWESPEEYWLIATGPDSQQGINGGLVKRRGPIDGTAVIAYVCTIDVASLDDSIEKVIAHGGTLALPKQGVPTMGWLAYCKDLEGNIFGMMQIDPNAK